MPKYTGLRGTVVIKPEYVSYYFTDTDTYFAEIPVEISQYVSAYSHSWEEATRKWTFNWTFTDADALIDQIIQLDVGNIAEWIESFVLV